MKHALWATGAALALGVAVACNDYGEDDPAKGPTDAGGGNATDVGATSSSGDARPEPPDGGPIVEAGTALCSPTAPFETVVPVPGLPIGAQCPTLSTDEKTVTYTYNAKLWRATLAGASFGAATQLIVDGLGENPAPGCTTFLPDDSVIVFERFFHVYRAVRTPGGSYGPLVEIPAPAEDYFFARPYYAGASNELFFTYGATADALSGPYEIRKASVMLDGTPSTFTSLKLGDTGALSPVVSADGLALYYGSGTGADGGADRDIWVTTRAGVTVPFQAPTRIGSVNSGQPDLPTWISPDNCRLYFMSTRGSASQTSFVATRKP